MYIGTLKPTTNRSSWSEIIEIYDSETGDLFDLTGSTIVFQFRHPDRCGPTLTAATNVFDIGKFTASLTVDQMRTLYPATYAVGCTISRDGSTEEFINGSIPVMDGIVS